LTEDGKLVTVTQRGNSLRLGNKWNMTQAGWTTLLTDGTVFKSEDEPWE
jgi:hypothetical protein